MCVTRPVFLALKKYYPTDPDYETPTVSNIIPLLQLLLLQIIIHLRRMVSNGNKVCLVGLARSTLDDMFVQPDAKSWAQFMSLYVVHIV
jgi:hypothetical protein